MVRTFWQELRDLFESEGLPVDDRFAEKIRERLQSLGMDSEDGIGGFMREQLRKWGVELDVDCADPGNAGRVKVVCVSPNLKETVDEMGRSQRDQVVMVRIDEETSDALDDWVATGAVKSRSQAAAVFIREGLNVRAAELEQLRDALRDVERAKEKLEAQARKLFGGDDQDTPKGEGEDSAEEKS